MRADRLIAALLVLQARRQVTAAELANELEVSVATARRDLHALSIAGVPVYSQPGRGGGWSLIGRARTDLTGLTAGEARALLTLIGTSKTTPAEVTSVLRKLVQALPETFRADARAAAESMVVDARSWGASTSDRPPQLTDLHTAIIESHQIELAYVDGEGNHTERTINPWGLVDKDDTWYLVAGTSKGRRFFRVDRIVTAVVTDHPADRPKDFDLDHTWQDVVDHVEHARSRTWATVTTTGDHIQLLRIQFGRHCHSQPPAPDGTCRVRVASPTPQALAQKLAGFGHDLLVEGPPDVCVELARIGRELTAYYGP